VNSECYLQVLGRVGDAIRRNRPEKWSSGDWQIRNDKAAAHSAQLVQHFLAKRVITQVKQPPYSPGLALYDIFISQNKTGCGREKIL
jgi:hypothetical protein